MRRQHPSRPQSSPQDAFLGPDILGPDIMSAGSQLSVTAARPGHPNDVHVAACLGAVRSRLRPQELAQSLTSWCGTPSPRSSDAMARLTPATRHSFTSRYALSASAARNERLRPVLLASFSRRFLICRSTRTVKVVDGMVSILGVRMCT